MNYQSFFHFGWYTIFRSFFPPLASLSRSFEVKRALTVNGVMYKNSTYSFTTQTNMWRSLFKCNSNRLRKKTSYLIYYLHYSNNCIYYTSTISFAYLQPRSQDPPLLDPHSRSRGRVEEDSENEFGLPLEIPSTIMERGARKISQNPPVSQNLLAFGSLKILQYLFTRKSSASLIKFSVAFL